MYTDEALKRHLAYERKQKAWWDENNWWYNFYEAAGSKNYDAEVADRLRINGISPEEAAKQVTF